MKSKKGIIIGGVVVVGIVGLLVAKNILGSNNQPVGVVVMSESVKKDTIVTTVSAKGEVSLLNTELIYANTVAEIGEVLVEKNDEVKKGDVLIRYTEKSKEAIENKIRDAELSLRSAKLTLSDANLPVSETAIESAKLTVIQNEQDIQIMEMTIKTSYTSTENAKTTIANAEKDYANSQVLYAAGILSKSELDKLETALKETKDALVVLENKQTENELKMQSLKQNLAYNQKVYEDTINKNSTQSSKNTIERAQISVEQANIVLADLKKELADFQMEIVSPIDGTVTMLNVSKGEVPSTDKTLMEIANVEDYIIKVDVNERNASKVALGQSVDLKGAVLGSEVLSGKVTKIGNIAEQKSTTGGSVERVIPVEITVTDGGGASLLKPGFSLEAVITTQIIEDVVVIPILSTLKDSEGNTYVYVVNADNTLEKRIIELGVYADMTVEAVNIEEREIIVSQPSIDMTEGMAVIVMPTGDENEQAETEGDGN